MRVLLDTHVLIWLVEGDKNLSTVARSRVRRLLMANVVRLPEMIGDRNTIYKIGERIDAGFHN